MLPALLTCSRCTRAPRSAHVLPLLTFRLCAVSLCWGCTKETLEAELKNRPTARLLFSGHAHNACYGLGFTKPGGGFAPLPTDEVAALLGQYSTSKGGKLHLVMLNACKTEPLGDRLRAAGVAYVICWRTPTHDKAARLFASTFFKACAAAAMAAVPAPQPQVIRAAFDEAVDAMKTSKRNVRNLDTKEVYEVNEFEVAAPPDPPPSGVQSYPHKSGVPVLLCDGAGGVGVPFHVGA